MFRPCGQVLLAWLSIINLANSAPSTGLTRGYLPPPPPPPVPAAAPAAVPSCEVVVREVDREVEMEECRTVEEEKCETSVREVCEDQQTEKCESVVEQVCTSVEAGFFILTNSYQVMMSRMLMMVMIDLLGLLKPLVGRDL